MAAFICFCIAALLFALGVFGVAAVFSLPTTGLGLFFMAVGFVIEAPFDYLGRYPGKDD